MYNLYFFIENIFGFLYNEINESSKGGFIVW